MRRIARWIGLAVIILLLLSGCSCAKEVTDMGIGTPTVPLPIPRTATLVVAAGDSSPKSRSQADYVCSQANFHTVMAQAIADLPDEGGNIHLTEGTFLKAVGDGIEITKNNVSISGCGKATVIRLADSINTDGSIFEATGRDGIAILDMLIDGNNRNQTSGKQYGVKFTDCSNVKVDCWIENFRTADHLINTFDVDYCNRNYSDKYMPRVKSLLTIDGTDGWSVIEGDATLSQHNDGVTSENCLRIEVPANSYAVVEHALNADLRFYPVLCFYGRGGYPHAGYTPRYAPMITLVDSAGNEVSSDLGTLSFRQFAIKMDRNALAEYLTWDYLVYDMASFDWTTPPYYMLGDIAKIRIRVEAHSSLKAWLHLDYLYAVRGMMRPLKTFIFDDSLKDRYNISAPVLKEHGFSACYAINSLWVESDGDAGTWEDYIKLHSQGFDIINHSASHWNLGDVIAGAPDDANNFNYGGLSRGYWEWYAGRAALEERGLFSGSEFTAHAGSHPDYPYYQLIFSKYVTAARYYNRPGAYLPYELPQLPPYGLVSAQDLLTFHLWTLDVVHAVTDEISWRNTVKDYEDKGVECVSFSEVYKRYPLVDKPVVSFEPKSYVDFFYNLLAADDDLISGAAGWAGTGAKQTITSFAGQPDYPRNVSITCTNNASPSGDIIVEGIDARGIAMKDAITIVPGGTAYSWGAFSKITKVTIPAGVTAADTITMGISDRLGLTHWILQYTDVSKITRNGEDVAVTESMFHTAPNELVAWDAAVDLATITGGDDIVIYYKSNM